MLSRVWLKIENEMNIKSTDFFHYERVVVFRLDVMFYKSTNLVSGLSRYVTAGNSVSDVAR